MTAMTAHEIDIEIGQMEIVAAEATAQELLLPSWGQWKRRGDSLRHLDYPPCILGRWRSMGTSAPEMSAVIPEITDEQGNRIELAVRSLPKDYRLLITALYLARVSVNSLSKINHTTRANIDQMHNRALGMLEEKLK